MPRMLLPRRLLPWLFALSLLFGQAAAFAHALTHLTAPDPALPESACAVCVAQAQLETAVAPATVVLSIPPGDPLPITTVAPACVDLAPRAACARAPPTAVHA
jgi:hypothetical protein